MALNGSKSTQDQNLNNLGSTRVHNAIYIGLLVLEKKIFKEFTIFVMTAMLVMSPRPFEKLFVSKSPGGCIKFGYDQPSCYRVDVV